MEQTQKPRVADPLLALAGTLECEIADIENTMPATIRKTNTNQFRETQDIDPLLALAGTLECEVTDISKHHDDYIGDALVAELQEDNDE